jgi:hypothetical protein
MSRTFRLLLVLVLTLLAVSPVYAQGPGVQSTDPVWQASYWNNTALSGTPVLTRTDASVDFDWGAGSPDASVNADSFSARWTRYLAVSAGTYRFTVTSDDGIRLWVDSILVIDQWNDHAAATFTGDVALTAGTHLVKVEYYENTIFAMASVAWPPSLVAGSGWLGEYFNNTGLSGSPTLSRADTNLSFDWGTGAPDGSLPADGFSVRWTRTVNFAAGMVSFTACADDGVRLWVNSNLLIDQWTNQPITCFTDSIYVSGDVPLRMEYYENTGLAAARLTWTGSASGSVTPPAGAIIVDDLDAGFVKGGAATGWRGVAEGYDGHLTWTRNNDYARYNYNWGRWYPSLGAGRYEVFVFIPDRYTTTSNARYWVSHRDGFTLKVVSQNTTGSKWVSLGTYWFRGTSDDYVSLSDITYETYLSRIIAWDATAWVAR